MPMVGSEDVGTQRLDMYCLFWGIKMLIHGATAIFIKDFYKNVKISTYFPLLIQENAAV